MQDLRITVEVPASDSFDPGRSYDVVLVQAREFLVIDDEGRFRWLAADAVQPATVALAGERVFDRETYLARRRLESLVGKAVVLTTWEHIDFDPDETTEENMLVYRGVVDSYDGETLFLHRPDGEQFAILPRGIATIEEDAG